MKASNLDKLYKILLLNLIIGNSQCKEYMDLNKPIGLLLENQEPSIHLRIRRKAFIHWNVCIQIDGYDARNLLVNCTTSFEEAIGKLKIMESIKENSGEWFIYPMETGNNNLELFLYLIIHFHRNQQR
jgi:hypothetical protein